MTHTPTPWAVGPYGGVYRINDDGIHGPLIVSGETRNGTLPNKEENEAFIVAAVNAYDKHRALIETLTAALKPFAALATEFLDDGDMANKADDRTVWGFNDHDVSYGDFRRAHAALAAAKEQSA